MEWLDEVGQSTTGRAWGGSASGGRLQKEWSTKFEMRSPRYTTNWDELPEAR